MRECRTIADVRVCVREARRALRRIGCVPTMGALHEGHISLMQEARRSCDFVVATIFVNPTQFAPNEDFSRYPRDEAGDLAICRDQGVDAVFLPSVDEMYAAGAKTFIHVRELTDTLCGPFRPGHFDGVCTVVAKLFNIIQPDSAFFGEKDAQQLAIIRRMVADLDIPVAIVGCPTVREPDGLALSSRNRYLSPEERIAARCLHRSLLLARKRIMAGETRAGQLVNEMFEIVHESGATAIDYISIVDPHSLQVIEHIVRPVLVALAVRFGQTRLIDNMTISPPPAGRPA